MLKNLKTKVKKGIARIWFAIAVIIALVIAFAIYLIGATTMVVYGPAPG